jgi:hypothetical protein
MKKEYIVSTDFFNKRSTWIFRALRFLIGMLVLYLVDLQELENGSEILVLGFVFAAFLAIVFVVWPTTELALDKDNIYFIRKSLWSELNRTKEYKISNFKGIGTYNISKPPGILALFIPVWDVYRVEMIFKDDSSSSTDLMIPKKDLKKILLMVRGMIQQDTPTSKAI